MLSNHSSPLSVLLLLWSHLQPARAESSTFVAIYNTSTTPAHLPWNTYNYCNAPHVSAEHYEYPQHQGAQLKHVTVFMRHHKRTPDNLYPTENSLNPLAGWNCTNFLQNNYGGHTAPINHQITIPEWHPFLPRIWNGSCDAGQLTAEGLEDAIQHGKDLWSVYGGAHGFIQSINHQDIYIRTSNSDRTYQVSGGLLFGMDPKFSDSFQVFTQPSHIDSLVPSYSCPRANQLRDHYQEAPEWTHHMQETEPLRARLDEVLGTHGLGSWHNWHDHYFDSFTSRTCHGHPLPCNRNGHCVEEADAASIHDAGHFEYNYIWNTASGAKRYVQLTFGAMFLELARNMRALASDQEPYKMRLYVGHDGSMIRLASGLGIGGQKPLRWPALGSEIIMEVWEIIGSITKERFVRVLHEGTAVKDLEWIPFSEFLRLLDDNVPTDLFEACST
ncbi:phosphoglycerate mutase-like protein [Clavulina sp. PMI_390]|nr:phosphoglycerate mutase-like protein [Clavulina sp. PMI_390]